MKFVVLFIACFAFLSGAAQQTAYHEFVNPFIGTGGHGHTYPGVSAPFGMMQLSPDTRLEGWDGCGGYHYSDSVIYGFSHTHLSGTGVSDYADLLIMPFTGKTAWNSGYYSKDGTGYGSIFSHDKEKANAGSYSVFLEDDEIGVELATTTRCGIHQYTYPKWKTKKIIIDLTHRDQLIDTDLILINDSTIIGKRISKAWALEQHFYFTILFSEKSIKSEFQKDEKGKPTKLVLEFGHDNPVLQIKVGMSAVDIDGAKRNLKREMPHWDIEKYRTENQNWWDKELGKIKIETTSESKKKIFYTALYHSFLNPNTFSDVDGRYRGLDKQIHVNQSMTQYTIFSLWDTFRGTHPLFTITQQKRTEDFLATFLNQYQEGGILPIWELSGNYTGCMIGYHSIPVIVDAYVKGIRNFDHELALKAMLHSAEQAHLGLEAYQKQGYISSEDESESVSKTLEYAYDDWCIAIFADSLGYDSIAAIYYKRGQYYKNLLNQKSKFMEPRYNGGWKETFKPAEVTFDYTEANSWQYSLFAPQDVNGLANLLGGRDSLEAWLDRLFTTKAELSGRHQVDITGLIGQYAHGNEPSHHMAYLYNFTNSSWKTQKYIHQISTTLYSNEPDGLSGNEDCGQMSSWYVLSSLGFYSYAPGSDIYLIGTPAHKFAEIQLENGKRFQVKTTNFTKRNSYVKSIQLNGKTLDRNYIYHDEIMNGGVLTFEMSQIPIQNDWRSPSSTIQKNKIVPSPAFINPRAAFEKKKKVIICANTGKDVTIRYTTDGTIPTAKSQVYKKPVKIKKSTQFVARSFNQYGASFPVTSNYKLANKNWDISLKTEYANQYSGGGQNGLIDQLYGGKDFRTGSWQGYYGKNIEVEIDFREKKKIESVAVNFIQDIKSWIWMPLEVRFLISEDGKNWFNIHTEENKVPYDQYGALIAKIGFEKSFTTRYLKIVAVNRGVCPDWHPGVGNDTWLFADEIEVK